MVSCVFIYPTFIQDDMTRQFTVEMEYGVLLTSKHVSIDRADAARATSYDAVSNAANVAKQTRKFRPLRAYCDPDSSKTTSKCLKTYLNCLFVRFTSTARQRPPAIISDLQGPALCPATYNVVGSPGWKSANTVISSVGSPLQHVGPPKSIVCYVPHS